MDNTLKKITLYCILTLFLGVCASCDFIDSGDPKLTRENNLKNSIIELKDFGDNTVTLNSTALRIIALAPHIVENLFSVGLGEKIIGVVSHSDFPEEAKLLPIIGHYNGISIEKILSLKPDLVIAWSSGTSTEIIQKLKDLGIPVYLDNPKTLSDIKKSLKDFAYMGGAGAKELKVVEDYSMKVDRLKSQYSTKKRLSVFILIGEKPLRTLNGKHIVSDMINNCGGENIFSELTAIAPTINYESLLSLTPQVILLGAKTQQQAEARLKKMNLKFMDINNFQEVELEKNRKFKPFTLFANPDMLYRHTVRMADAMKSVCKDMDNIRKAINSSTMSNER